MHWTGVKLHGWLKEQLAVDLGYRTVLRYLHELNYNLRVPQRWPERQDEAQRAAFLEELHQLREDPAVCPATGESFTMIFDGVDTDVFQCYLDHLTETIPPKPSRRTLPNGAFFFWIMRHGTKRPV